MSRTRRNFDEKLIQKLKDLTCQTFQKPIDYSYETELLSEDIRYVTGVIINPHTLRRLFGFLKTEFSPSIKTLDALALYNGFLNWHSFTKSSSLNYEPLTLDQESKFYLDFYKIEMRTERDMNYHNASRNIALRILSNQALLSKLSPALAKNPVSQIYFFEHFPYIDGLCSDYKRSIQMYLQKKDSAAHIFGNSLLFLSSFLGERDKELELYVTRMNEVQLHKSMHPFTIARYVGTNILYNVVSNQSLSHLLESAEKWNKHFLQRNIGPWHYPYFQHMICDYLNLAGLFSESCHFIRTKNQMKGGYEIEQGYSEALEVITQIANHSSSRSEYIKWFQTTKAFRRIHPIFKTYYRLQALCFYNSIESKRKKTASVNNELSTLINTTGFNYFKKYLHKPDTHLVTR